MNNIERKKEIIEETSVDVNQLAEMTGFPVDFIKSELLLESNSLSIDEFRKTMVSYLTANK
ncbi:MAG: hypothetical protein HOJ35_07050 [Bdellovibrionales bacterium]|jgi:hypothetical protein|nr:hypothetical protein [Bdellovibrionales bacterium]